MGRVGWAMGSNLTAVVEARLLVREALKSLMVKNSYRVICDVGSTAEINAAAVQDKPKLVILGAQSVDSAIAEAVALRKLWPGSKIVLLNEQASLDDFQQLLTSQIDGCIPVSVSPDTLIGTLGMIMTGAIRIMMPPDAKSSLLQPERPDEPDQPENKVKSLQSGAARLPALSQREVQILDGLVKGHANKLIARTCDMAEATVKVHVKSILRKIRVRNRTQAAIWALENGYSCRRSKLASDEAVTTTTGGIGSTVLRGNGADICESA